LIAGLGEIRREHAHIARRSLVILINCLGPAPCISSRQISPDDAGYLVRRQEANLVKQPTINLWLLVSAYIDRFPFSLVVDVTLMSVFTDFAIERTRRPYNLQLLY
jgi:hypothetical protein